MPISNTAATKLSMLYAWFHNQRMQIDLGMHLFEECMNDRELQASDTGNELLNRLAAMMAPANPFGNGFNATAPVPQQAVHPMPVSITASLEAAQPAKVKRAYTKRGSAKKAKAKKIDRRRNPAPGTKLRPLLAQYVQEHHQVTRGDFAQYLEQKGIPYNNQSIHILLSELRRTERLNGDGAGHYEASAAQRKALLKDYPPQDDQTRSAAA